MAALADAAVKDVPGRFSDGNKHPIPGFHHALGQGPRVAGTLKMLPLKGFDITPAKPAETAEEKGIFYSFVPAGRFFKELDFFP